MDPNKIKNILSLEVQERYNYLIRRAADFEEIWLVKSKEGQIQTVLAHNKIESIPIWPEKEFAELSFGENYIYESMDLYEFIDWLIILNKEKIKIAAFPLPDLSSIQVHPLEIKKHLELECEQYK